MLVTLGTNTQISAGSSATMPYACKSVQKVFIKVDDDATAYDHRITIQLGSRTIVNGASAWGLKGFSFLESAGDDSDSMIQYGIDLGSHQLLDSENLYVTVNAASALVGVDVSALVDEPVGELPVRYTEYSDNVFTAENVLTATSYDSARQVVDEDDYNIEIRTAVNSSSPNLISANNWFMAESFTGNGTIQSKFGLLCKNPMPLTTTFNYNSSAVTDRILVASQMGTNQRAINQGNRQKAIARSAVGK